MEKEPKDLGIKIGTKEEAYWDNVLKQSEELIVKGTADLEINKGISELAKRRVAEERQIMLDAKKEHLKNNRGKA